MALQNTVSTLLLVFMWMFTAKVSCADPILTLKVSYLNPFVFMNCDASYLPDSSKIEFFKETDGVQSAIIVSDRYQLFGKSLVLSSFKKTDEGKYGCRSNVDGTIWSSQSVFVWANAEPAKIIRDELRDVNLWRGQDFQVICNATGVPSPTIHWEKESTGFKTEGPVLHLTSVTKENSGEYICFATNGIGTKPDRAIIGVNVIFYPITIVPENTVITIERGWGQIIKLKCVVDGGRTPVVTYWKETSDGVVEIPNDRIKYLHNKNWTQGWDISNERWHILFIEDIELADSGTYIVRAKNEHETVEKKYYVTVT